MTDIEQKALALVNEIERKFQFCGNELTSRIMRGSIWDEALCRAIEQHEAFRQEVSDAVEDEWEYPHPPFKSFIIPKPKPDPLVEALDSLGLRKADEWAGDIRKALAARGLEIREKK